MIERIRALRKAGAPVSLLAIDASSADLTPPPVPTPEQEEGVRARAKEMNSEAFIPVLLNAAAATTVRDRVMAQLVGDALRRTTLSTSALGGAAWACLPGGSGCGPLPFPPSNEQRTARGAGVYLSGELQDYDGLDNLKGYDGLIVFARATPAEPAVPTPAQAPGKRSRPKIACANVTSLMLPRALARQPESRQPRRGLVSSSSWHSHRDLNTTPLDAYEADVLCGEA